MDFFSGCKDADEVKSLYKRFAICLHPDKGGDNELMAELTRQRDTWKLDTITSQPIYGHIKASPIQNAYGQWNMREPINIFEIRQKMKDLEENANRLSKNNGFLSLQINDLNISLHEKSNEIKDLKFAIETYCKSIHALKVKNDELTGLLHNAEELLERVTQTLKSPWKKFKDWLNE